MATSKAPSGRRLVIVESPSKARKIAEYLGAGFDVEASVGHIRDLPQPLKEPHKARLSRIVRSQPAQHRGRWLEEVPQVVVPARHIRLHGRGVGRFVHLGRERQVNILTFSHDLRSARRRVGLPPAAGRANTFTP